METTRQKIRKELEAEVAESDTDTLPTEAEYEAEIDRRIATEAFAARVNFQSRQNQESGF